MREHNWVSFVDGTSYAFSFRRGLGKFHVSVNGMPMIVNPGFMSLVTGLDEAITFNGKEARVVQRWGKPDIAYKGRFIRSGKEYNKCPIWVLVFVLICALVPMLYLGGIINWLVGFGGAAACIAVARSSLRLPARIFLAILFTLLTFGLWLLFSLLLIAALQIL